MSQEFYDRIEFPWADHGESPDQVISKLQEQLYAARVLSEKRYQDILVQMRDIKQLREQLADEREAGVKVLAERSFELHGCQKQLAVDQEIHEASVRTSKYAINELQSQLAAERERIRVLESGTALNAVIETNKQLREQIAVSVEALKEAREMMALRNGIGQFDDDIERIDAALAKIQKP